MDLMYFAKSKVKLEAVSDALREAYDLPSFAFDSGKDWRQARSEGPDFHLAIIWAKHWATLCSWDDDWPVCVNYLVILSEGAAPPDFEERLAQAFQGEVVRYARGAA